MRRRITIADVTASLDPAAVRENNWTVRVCRPLANILTPPLYNVGLSANSVTGLRALASFAAAGALAYGDGYMCFVAWLLFFIGFLLDCIDGNIARLSEHVTYWGKFIDGLSDMVYFAFAPLAAAFALWRDHGDALGAALGVGASVVVLVNHMLRARFSFFRDWMVQSSGPLSDETQSRLAYWDTIEATIANCWVATTALAPFLLFTGHIAYYLYPIALFELIVNPIWSGVSLRKAYVVLSRSRRSRHSALKVT